MTVSEPMGPHQYTGLARIFHSLYLRAPRGIARVCVSGFSGALFIVICAARRNGSLTREYWFAIGLAGLLIGTIGGVILGVLEHRELRGEGLPVWWLVFKRIIYTFLILVFCGLFSVLAYVIFFVAKDNHLYGL